MKILILLLALVPCLRAQLYVPSSTARNFSVVGTTISINTNHLVVTNGLVGIGTTAPSASLHVYNAAAPDGIIAEGPTSAFGYLALRAGSGSIYLYQFGTSYSSSGAYQANGGVLEAATAGGLSVVASHASGPVRFYTAGSGDSNERMRITSAGNVGIGTAVPENKLTISDGAAPFAPGVGEMLQLVRTGGNTNAANAVRMRMGNSLGNIFDIVYGGTSDRLGFVNGGGVEALTIMGSGNVGIDTTAPLDKFHVVGGIVQTNGGVWQHFSITAPSAPAANTQGAVYWNDGTNICAVFRNAAGALSTNKLSMTAWP